MPSSFRTPKTLADWLRLDAFRREGGLRRQRAALAAGAMAACLLGVAATLALPGGRRAYEAGPVSRGHAEIADRCEKCHTQPFRTAARFAGDGPTVSDDACRACHGKHAHHADEEARSTRCAACHREHRGPTALALVADDRNCTGCHADLARSVKAGEPVRYQDVPDFAGHPEFDLWRNDKRRRDPGRLNFSHHDHLVPLGLRGQDGKLPPVLRELGCADCHEPDAGGLFMQPIRYEKHCAQCHDLFAPLDGGQAAQEFRRTRLPHPGPGQSAETVRGVLRDRLTRLAQEHPEVMTGAAEPERPLPGGRRAPPVSAEVFRWVDRHLGEAERVLFDKTAGCLLCHQEEMRRNGLPHLATPDIPERWLSHSTFSHRSHQAYRCAECHPGVENSKDAADVLIPRIGDCRRCHNADSGVRSGCVDCHAYHRPGAGAGN
jgi:predicted CXXCH cytochrome family protein